MNTFNDQREDPTSLCIQNVPQLANVASETVSHPVEISSAVYAGLIDAVITLSIIILLLLGFILWNFIASRKTKHSNASNNPSVDVEKGARNHHNTPETPDTVVGIDRSKHQPIHMSKDDSSQDSHSYYKTPATPAGSPASPYNETSRAEEMSVGDRLRSHLMVRETTGNFPQSADPEFLSTLPLEENGQRCSSLYTIEEADVEASSSSSPEPLSPTTPIPGTTDAALSSVPL